MWGQIYTCNRKEVMEEKKKGTGVDKLVRSDEEMKLRGACERIKKC
jgi:hypothetical protein